MSTEPQKPIRRITVPNIAARKGGEPIVSLTSYHAHTAAIVDNYADFILVGDSLGMVMHGMESTIGVPLDLMIMHGSAVVRGTQRALIVVDMPFGSYEASPEQAFASASRVMQETGAAAVKMEGGEHMAPTIEFLSKRGIPVMGHVGLTPQSINSLGSYRARGKGNEESTKLLDDVKAIGNSGAFSMVIEGVMESVAEEAMGISQIPVIGIGASAKCDGQVLVTEDLLGMFERTACVDARGGELSSR